jgi:hypothetical protein
VGAHFASAAHSVAAAAAPLLDVLQPPPQPRAQLLWASVSGPALQEQEQQARAVLPDKRRQGAQGRAALPAADGGNGSSNGGEDGEGLMPDADENERFLVSEVDVVGVDGELKQIALGALNTRANFAYSLKEVGLHRHVLPSELQMMSVKHMSSTSCRSLAGRQSSASVAWPY